MEATSPADETAEGLAEAEDQAAHPEAAAPAKAGKVKEPLVPKEKTGR